jgi:hypothetical protein
VRYVRGARLAGFESAGRKLTLGALRRVTSRRARNSRDGGRRAEFFVDVVPACPRVRSGSRKERLVLVDKTVAIGREVRTKAFRLATGGGRGGGGVSGGGAAYIYIYIYI